MLLWWRMLVSPLLGGTSAPHFPFRAPCHQACLGQNSFQLLLRSSFEFRIVSLILVDAQEQMPVQLVGSTAPGSPASRYCRRCRCPARSSWRPRCRPRRGHDLWSRSQLQPYSFASSPLQFRNDCSEEPLQTSPLLMTTSSSAGWQITEELLHIS